MICRETHNFVSPNNTYDHKTMDFLFTNQKQMTDLQFAYTIIEVMTRRCREKSEESLIIGNEKGKQTAVRVYSID